MITARQYGEVVLPDDSTGQSPGTPSRVLGRATKLSQCKEGLARVFAIQVQSLLSITRVAVQVLSEPRAYHRLQSWLGAMAQCRGTMLIEARKLSRYTAF